MDTKVKYTVKILGISEVSLSDIKTKYQVDVPINRCPFLDEDEAVENGYTVQDSLELCNRANDYLKSFLTTGYCIGKPILVCHCFENLTWYLVDGIGRKTAMVLADKRGLELPFDTVPVVSYEAPTLEDVRAFTEHNNTLKEKLWSAKQKIGAHAKAVGGEAKDIYDDMMYYKEEVIKTTSMHIIGDVYFADKWSHLEGSQYKYEHMRVNHEAYKKAYAMFVNEVGLSYNTYSKNNKKKRDTVVRGQNPGITLMSYLGFIERQSLKFDLDPKEKIIEATKMIVERWDVNNEEDAFFKSMTLNKSHKVDIACIWNLGSITLKVFDGCSISEVETTYRNWMNGVTKGKRGSKKEYKKVG